MRIPDGFVEELRASASIVAVIGSYVSLKKAGKSFKGLCPFHGEKTPSFNVDEAKGFFHCFGCHEGGDVFKFVMLHDKVGFTDAVRRVAELSGVPLPRLEGRPGDERRERIYEIHEQALRVFREALAGREGSAGRAYLEKRGLVAETIETFELGVTPEGWEGLAQRLLRARFSAAELVAAGLCKERPQGPGLYDRFHERIIFPIRNAGGRLVAFGGRTLGGQEPKYLNSPETEVYSKGEVLYGLARAKEAARKEEQLVLVEGYLDLIALHQAGVAEVVASCGTSLTPAQARLIARHARRVLIAYDGDAAGQAAAKKALHVLVPEKLDVRVVALEAGEDPDDFVRGRGGAAFRERMTGARGFLEFLVEAAREADPRAGRDLEGKLRMVNEVLPLLARVADPVERALAAGRLAEVAGIDEGVLREAIQKAVSERRPELGPTASALPPAAAGWSEKERVLVRALLAGRESFHALEAELDPEDWAGLPSEGALQAIVASGRACGGAPDVAALLGELGPGDRDVLGQIVLSGVEASFLQARAALRKMRADRLRRELSAIKGRIAAADAVELDRLLERKLELSRQIDVLANQD